MPHRILHVVATRQRRGAEIFAAHLVEALDAEGTDQRVAVLRAVEDDGLTFSAPTAVVGDGWRAPGLRVSPRALRALRATIRAWDPDLVQAHGGESFKHVALARPRGAAPIVYRKIGSLPRGVRRGPRRVAHGRLIGRASAVVAVAESVRREVVEVLRFPSVRVVVIPTGRHPGRLVPGKERDRIREELHVPREAPAVLSLGALALEKDPLTHLAVVSRARGSIPDVVHIVAGDGPLRPAVEREVVARGSGHTTRILGVRDDIPDLLRSADVMLVASREEGLPGCVIEAGIVGLPVVAFAVGGISEAVIDGQTGYLVRPGDVDGLSNRLVELLRDGARRTAFGDAARQRSLARYDITFIAGKYRELYDRVVGGARP